MSECEQEFVENGRDLGIALAGVVAEEVAGVVALVDQEGD